MLKKSVSLLLALLLSLSCLGAFADAEIKVTVDGEVLDFDVQPFIENDRTLVPLRAIFEALGADVSWIDATKTVVATRGDAEISLTIGEDTLYKGKTPYKLDVPAKIVADRTFVPLRAVSEGLNADVSWVDTSKTVVIKRNMTDLDKFLAENTGAEDFFEVVLPTEVQKYNADFADDMENNFENFEKYVSDVWNQCQKEALLDVWKATEIEYEGGEDLFDRLQIEIEKVGRDANSCLNILKSGDKTVKISADGYNTQAELKIVGNEVIYTIK